MKLQLLASLALVCAGLMPARAADTPELPPLTTVSNSPRLVGKFVWADLVTDDVAAARKFYSHLFGWTFREVGDYTLAAKDDRPLAGMFQRQRPTDSTARPRWIPYMSVSSVSEAQDEVIKAGGKILAKQRNYPQRGDQAVFADPEGAVFGAIASRRGVQQDFLPDPGEWIWLQLLCHDAKAAGEFYKPLGRYDILPNTERTNCIILSAEGYARAAVLTLPESQSQVKPAWLPFVRVKSISASLQQTTDLGGRVLIAPKAELLQGHVAVIADPTGAAIGIMEWDQQDNRRTEQ